MPFVCHFIPPWTLPLPSAPAWLPPSSPLSMVQEPCLCWLSTTQSPSSPCRAPEGPGTCPVGWPSFPGRTGRLGAAGPQPGASDSSGTRCCGVCSCRGACAGLSWPRPALSAPPASAELTFQTCPGQTAGWTGHRKAEDFVPSQALAQALRSWTRAGILYSCRSYTPHVPVQF